MKLYYSERQMLARAQAEGNDDLATVLLRLGRVRAGMRGKRRKRSRVSREWAAIAAAWRDVAAARAADTGA